MLNRTVSLYLIAFPIGLMGTVQMGFALLSMLVFHDHEEAEFFEPALAMMILAIVLLSMARRFDASRIGYRDALLFAVLTWISCGVFGAIPIALVANVSFTDAVFESISALTTTGATVLSGLDAMPKSFLLYRQFLQWLGGLGVVIFVVAVLPMLNVGGMKLLRAETPGPIKDEKLSPRVANTAHYLWMVYIALTAGCALCYFWGGMSAFDAIAHSFTTVSTGGFSTHDASMGYFNSPTLLVVADVFMMLGAINFALHFRVASHKRLSAYWQDEETRTFIAIVVALSGLAFLVLLSHFQSTQPLLTLNESVFHVISFITSTGFGASDFTHWPAAATMLLVFAGYLGGCAGSTAGGNKIIRNLLCIKLIRLEFLRLVHPRGVSLVHYQGRRVGADVLSATMAFMTIAAVTAVLLSLALMATGLDFWSAFTAVAACQNVVGPAFGELGNNFEPVSDVGIWILSSAMILGRLEYFTVLALFLPSFWRE